jgi:hypothetical protein
MFTPFPPCQPIRTAKQEQQAAALAKQEQQAAAPAERVVTVQLTDEEVQELIDYYG